MKILFEIINFWKEHPEKSYRIIAFGSSNTELSWHCGGRHNWVDWLNINIRAQIGRHVSVINQGISGETSEDLLNRIERDVFSYNPEIAILTVAGNDALHEFSDERYLTNLRKICYVLLDNNILPVLQTYYCPVYNEGKENFREIFERYVQMNRDLAIEIDLPIIDQYFLFEPFYSKDSKKYKKMMLDWIHVNYIGNLIMGLNASKQFGLPNFQIPEDISEDVLSSIQEMEYVL